LTLGLDKFIDGCAEGARSSERNVKSLLEPDDGAEFIIHFTDYRSRSRDVLVLRIFGEDVTWVEDTSQAGEEDD
jgi:hypothetical protein